MTTAATATAASEPSSSDECESLPPPPESLDSSVSSVASSASASALTVTSSELAVATVAAAAVATTVATTVAAPTASVVTDLSVSTRSTQQKATATPTAVTSNKKDKDSNNIDNDNNDNASALRNRLNRQLKWLAVIRCLRAAHLAQPLLVPYYSHGLDLAPTGVLWLGSLYSALVTAAELPSGILSDRWGRRATLVGAFLGLGGSLWVTALVSCLVGNSNNDNNVNNDNVNDNAGMVWACLGLAQGLRAIGSSLYSGTDMAFLYEVLQNYPGEDVDNNSNSNSNNNNSSSKQQSPSPETMLLSIESRNVFATTVTEACVAAAGGWLASALGLPMVVGLAALPFFGGAVVAGVCLEEEATTKTKTETDTGSRKGAVGTSTRTRSSAPTTSKSKSNASASASASASAAKDQPAATTTQTNANAYASEPPNPSNAAAAESNTNQPVSDNNKKKELPHGGTTTERRTSFAAQRLPSTVGVSAPALLPLSLFVSIRGCFVRAHRHVVRECVAIPPRVRKLFAVGVALNCGTYVAATALNPLLWENVGIPLGSYGTLHAVCGAASSVGALLAPTLRRWLSVSPLLLVVLFPGKSNNGNNSTSSSTEALLLVLLGSSALAYGLMALAATLHRWNSATATTFSVPAMGCAVLAALLLSLVRGLAWPVLGAAINSAVDDNGSRATTLSLFSGAIKIGMVLTGMALGSLFRPGASTMTTRGNGFQDDSLEVGLVHGSILCGTTLASIAIWLATTTMDTSTRNRTRTGGLSKQQKQSNNTETATADNGCNATAKPKSE